MEPSEFEISFSVKSYDRNTTKKQKNTEKRIVYKLSKISISNLIELIEGLNKIYCSYV